ncbi:Gfo/Idh/MocA family oxidoreductase, partial [Candidatus Poribacteria bacterium]|nr:Gfo/Idh/MocA family oxidoreductase [Candidatus Poribacteria bacterium]
MASATQDSRIRFGVIGCGVVAPTHAIALEGIERADLVAVADSSASRVQNFAREFGVPKAYAGHEELIADADIDAICVCTPHHLHAPIAIEAARAGKHVLIEKPMATNLADADELIRICDEGDLRLGVVFQHRFDAASAHIKHLVDEGDLGTIALASVYVKWFRAADYYDPSSWRGKWDTAGGGVLI